MNDCDNKNLDKSKTSLFNGETLKIIEHILQNESLMASMVETANKQDKTVSECLKDTVENCNR